MYGYHRCRCTPCLEANRAYYQATAHLTRKRRWADAELARQRINVLRQAGLPLETMAEYVGVPATNLRYILRGPKNRTVQRVLQSTLDALNAISYRDIASREITDDTRVDGTVAALQTKALHADGWCVEALSERSGIGIQTFYRLLRGFKTTEEMRRRIDVLYLELDTQQPPNSSTLDQSRIRRATTRAVANGWTRDMAEALDYEAAA